MKTKVLIIIRKERDMDQNMLYRMALTMIPGIGGVQGKRLVNACGNVEAVFREKKKNLLKIQGVGKGIIASIHNKIIWEEAAKEIRFVEHYGIKTFFFLDEDYPWRLKHCDDGPMMVYFKGETDLNHPRIISIVGTRRPSDYGKEVCARFIRELSGYRLLVVSGLAYGIDTVAHQESIRAGLDTIAVLGHGLDKIYPFQNRVLAGRMVNHGGLLTEFPSGVKLNKDLFPRRNRIIAGMSDATLVIESADKGGALITADLANSYNRDVFAVPGRVDDPRSVGCNFLIKTNRAALVQSAADLVYFLGWDDEKKKETVQPRLFPELSPEEQQVYHHLEACREAEIDEIAFQTGLSTSKLASALLKLEFNGLIRCLPGKKYRIDQTH